MTRLWKKTVLAALVSTALVGAFAPAASAGDNNGDVTVDHGFNGGDISAGIIGGRPGSRPGSGSGRSGGGAPIDPDTLAIIQFRQRAQQLYCEGNLSLGFNLGVQNTAAGNLARLTDPTCQNLNPPPPPPPPTYGELRARSPIPAPVFTIAPTSPGLTGLETALQFTGDGNPRSVGVNLRGYSVTTRARLVAVSWQITGPVTASMGGRSAQYVFERKGTYTVSCTTAWTANATVTGYGIPTQNVGLGTRTITVSRTYDVKELRSTFAR